jgi:hypothetical protein
LFYEEDRPLRLSLVLLALLGSTAAFSPLQAYTDPGSGLLLWQSLVGVFVGASFLFRKTLHKLITRYSTWRASGNERAK